VRIAGIVHNILRRQFAFALLPKELQMLTDDLGVRMGARLKPSTLCEFEAGDPHAAIGWEAASSLARSGSVATWNMPDMPSFSGLHSPTPTAKPATFRMLSIWLSDRTLPL